MGSLEAFYYGVPVIGIPIFADQYRNVNVLVHKGMGVKLRYENLSEETMNVALSTVLNNPSYMEVTKREVLHFKDRPMTAREIAIF
ncbi:UDP-glucuronosyltransferase 2B1-like [Harpegnathos saltator]|nr:UDP-glucuronosyltransferase 2B1-like [Harpegnathos saltator]